MKMEQIKLAEIIENHASWLTNSNDGIRANLRGADLSGADLREADLRGANLGGADLGRAKGKNFCLGYFGRHHAIAAGGYISIGCERHTYQEWLDNYQEIGKKYNYSDEEIEIYGQWIEMATRRNYEAY